MEKYIPRFFNSPKQSFFLFGPRGTGKSTYLKKNFKGALYIDLLRPDEFRKYSAKPERLINLVEGNPGKNVIIIDEIQKVPELLSSVHYLIEREVNKKFILTGSSARKLRRSGTNLLAGRVVLRNIYPFLYSEIKDHFSFADIFKYGLVPIVLSSKNMSSVLDTYVSLYLKEEVQSEGYTRNFGNFSRFLESISFSHGSLLNISNVARECEVERKTVEGYVQILEDILIAEKLHVFTKRAKRKLVKHPKFYFFDTGVYRTLRPKGPYDKPEEIDGLAMEGLIFQHLNAWNNYGGKNYDLFFWRSRKGVEVDFVLYGRNSIYAIEVKYSDKIRKEDLRPLNEFRQDYPDSRTILIYNGDEKLLIDKTLCIPCQNFLAELVPGKDFSFE